jgi:uncharacterized protein
VSRTKWGVAAATVGLPILLGVWATLIEPRLLALEEEVAAIPDLPDAWEGHRVALLGDLHVGMWLDNRSTIRQAVARIVDERPALVLLAGDFLYRPLPDVEVEIQAAVAAVLPLAMAGIPTYAVLGNHDYAVDQVGDSPLGAQTADRLVQSLEDAGIRVLRNEAVRLTPPTLGTRRDGNPVEVERQALHLVGLAPHRIDRENVCAALSEVPVKAPRIVLMHNPESFPALPAGTAPFAVAGHNHGGQVRVPFKPDWSGAIVTGMEVRRDGWIAGYGQAGNSLYINRGIGMSLLPIRLFCRPAVTFFTLRQVPAE